MARRALSCSEVFRTGWYLCTSVRLQLGQYCRRGHTFVTKATATAHSMIPMFQDRKDSKGVGADLSVSARKRTSFGAKTKGNATTDNLVQ